ncbi:MAG: hypothetical protein WCJ58_01220 [bacterium]
MKQGFNLLKQQVEPPTVWNKVYDWIVGTARLVVIVVEVIVVIAFVVRLIIDVQSADLDKKIQAKENQVTLFKESGSVDKYNRIQNKTKAFNDAWTETPIFSKIYAEINSYMPVSGEDININMDQNEISITGKASVKDIGILEVKFKSSSNLQWTEVNKIETQGSSPDEIADFVITTKLKSPEMRKIYEVTK